MRKYLLIFFLLLFSVKCFSQYTKIAFIDWGDPGHTNTNYSEFKKTYLESRGFAFQDSNFYLFNYNTLCDSVNAWNIKFVYSGVCLTQFNLRDWQNKVYPYSLIVLPSGNKGMISNPFYTELFSQIIVGYNAKNPVTGLDSNIQCYRCDIMDTSHHTPPVPMTSNSSAVLMARLTAYRDSCISMYSTNPKDTSIWGIKYTFLQSATFNGDSNLYSGWGMSDYANAFVWSGEIISDPYDTLQNEMSDIYISRNHKGIVTVSWDTVVNAKKYEVFLNGELITSVNYPFTFTQFYLSNLNRGTVNIGVRANRDYKYTTIKTKPLGLFSRTEFRNVDIVPVITPEINGVQVNLTVLIDAIYDGGTQILDTVQAVFWSSTDSLPKDTLTIPLDETGYGSVFTTDLSAGYYYIAIIHWKVLETWSQEFLITGDTLIYDFTTGQNKALGDILEQVGDKWCLVSGDVFKDLFIDLLDYNEIYNNRGVEGYLVTDLNNDGITNEIDELICDENSLLYYGTVKPF